MNPSESSENPELRLAFRLAEHTGTNIFLTGKAGTGKTTFLRNLCTRSSKRIVVAAPTGIAAINARGTTLHSLLQLSFGPYIPGARREAQKFSKRKLALIRSMDMLVIDEVSMVRADLLDYVDEVLRRVRNPNRPFGGVQLLLIGDLQQLPPVVKEDEWMLLRDRYASPYFFHSQALAAAGYITLELGKVYRQDDAEFLSLLNNIRSGRDLPLTLETLNRRYLPSFKPPTGEHWIRLTTHNATARSIKDSEMARIAGKEKSYSCIIDGQFPENAYPADETLRLKVGAQVMFIKNDTESHLYFNGMIGTVQALGVDEVTVRVPDVEQPITVGRAIWENTRYDIDPKTKEMTEVVDGAFAQIPLRTAWAITIHKSQGLTFNHACIDASSSFAHGQAYVALSRCRNLEGLVLTSPLRQDSIITDPAVNNFLEQGRLTRPDGSQVTRLELEYVATLLDKLFLPDQIERYFGDFHRVAEEAFRSTYPNLMQRYSVAARDLAELRKVGYNFAAQYRGIIAADTVPLSESELQSRVRAGAKYFYNRLIPVNALLSDTPTEHDSSQLQKRLERTREPLRKELLLTIAMLKYLEEHPFSTAEYLKRRAQLIVMLEEPGGSRKADAAQRKERKGRQKAAQESTDISNPELFAKLRRWRMAKAKELEVAAFQVLSTKALISICNNLPVTPKGLMECNGIGPTLAERHGEDVIKIVANYIRTKK